MTPATLYIDRHQPERIELTLVVKSGRRRYISQAFLDKVLKGRERADFEALVVKNLTIGVEGQVGGPVDVRTVELELCRSCRARGVLPESDSFTCVACTDVARRRWKDGGRKGRRGG